MVEAVTAPKLAKQVKRVQTLLREAEAQGTSTIPTTYQRGRVEVPPMSFTEEDLNDFASLATNFQ